MEKADDEQLVIKIDAYLKGHLSEKEATAFAQEIATDAALAQQVTQQQVHLEALDILLEDDLRAKMKNWETETVDDYADSNKWKKWGLGLLIVAILLSLYFLFKSQNKAVVPIYQKVNEQDSLSIDKNKKPINSIDTLQTKPNMPNQLQQKTPSVLEEKNMIVESQTLPNDILATANDDLAVVLTELENIQMRRIEERDTLLDEAYRLMQLKRYSSALVEIKGKVNVAPNVAFLQAIAYFLNKQYKQALPIFENYAQNKGFDRTETAEYYAALCLLAIGQKQEAKKSLTKMANDKKHQYSINAKIMIKKLEN